MCCMLVELCNATTAFSDVAAAIAQQAPLAGRLLYRLQLQSIVNNVTTKIDPADRACIL